MEETQQVVIVGGGIAGLATALALKRVGVQSLVLERAHELRFSGAAISIFPNGWRALGALGIASKLEPLYRPFETRNVTNIVTGDVQKASFTGTKNSEGVRTLHRKVLLKALAEELSPDTIRFSSKLISIKTEISEDSSTVTLLHLEDGAVIRAKILIGCDGAHSVVAQWLGLTPPRNSGRSAVRGLSVFPQGHGFKHEVYTYLSNNMRTGFAPVSDTEIYWGTVHNTTEREEKMACGDPKVIQTEVLEHIAKDFPADFLRVVRNSDLSTVTWAPLIYRAPWDLIIGKTHKGSVVLAGDAMHPMTPDLGQGGGSALEDTVVLVRNIVAAQGISKGMINEKGVEKGIEEYMKERRWRVVGFIVGSYVTGVVNQGGSGLFSWAVKWFRDHVHIKFVMPRVLDAVNYDCGDLPSAV